MSLRVAHNSLLSIDHIRIVIELEEKELTILSNYPPNQNPMGPAMPDPPPGFVYPVFPGFIYVEPDKGKGMAIAGFVVSLVSLVFWIIPTIGLAFNVVIVILGFIFSLLGRKSRTLKGLAIAGLVLSIIGGIVTALFIFNAIEYASYGWSNPYSH
jgi:hypothetical protein